LSLQNTKWYLIVIKIIKHRIKVSEGSQTHQPPQVPTWFAQKHPKSKDKTGKNNKMFWFCKILIKSK